MAKKTAHQRPRSAKKSQKRVKQTKKTHALIHQSDGAQNSLAARQKGWRRLNYRLWRVHRKQTIQSRQPVPRSLLLVRSASRLIWSRRWLFLGVMACYMAANLLLVHALASHSDVSSLKTSLSGSGAVKLISSVGILVVLSGSQTASAAGAAGVYQVILLVIGSLALIWTLRQVSASILVRARDAYYKGMYPLVPFVLLLVLMGLELLPLALAASIYNTVRANGISSGFIEGTLWTLLLVGAAAISLFWIASTLIALYIVTLPDMTPMKALRSARELTRYRHWTILGRLLSFTIILLVIFAIIMTPIIVFATGLTQWVFYVLSVLALMATHGYVYTLYRGLLHEQS